MGDGEYFQSITIGLAFLLDLSRILNNFFAAFGDILGMIAVVWPETQFEFGRRHMPSQIPL